MAVFNEDTRVKIPATVQFLRLGYDYQSLKDIDLHPEARIAINRFIPAISRLNGVEYTYAEAVGIIEDILACLKNNDLGKAFHRWLVDPQDKPKLIDFDDISNNDFAVVNELFFGEERRGSFRPDINILVNGIPLAFLEVKHPNNSGGIQAEFNRMLNERLENPDYIKYFNMLQVVSFSNNMEYESDDDASFAQDVKAGSFYTTPNGQKTTFSFFREEQPKTSGFKDISLDEIKAVLKDNHYSPFEANAPEFQTNLDPDTPCNSFVTSLFDPARLLYFIRYGILYVSGITPEKHIMRYPQYFAAQALVKRLENGGKSGIIWHTQGSGKTTLGALCTRILRDHYAKKNITARFYYVVDRLDLLEQSSDEMERRGLSVIRAANREEFKKELDKPISDHMALGADGEITVVNIHKFADDVPSSRNEYRARIQRVFFIDEAHRSYRKDGEFFKNLMLADPNAVYIALTGTPLLSKKERSNLKFGDYIHKYFYDKSIADGYTLRIKKESIETRARTEIRQNIELEDPQARKSDVFESEDYIQALCRYIDKDFSHFRLINCDDTIGGMIVCSSNPQAKKIKRWFDENSTFNAGLVISDKDIPDSANKQTQKSFKYELKPDILVVHQMLTTGYDVYRLKKMYLLRNAREHTLLQTISRVNRPYRSPNGKVYQYGYIVDFVDIEEEYDRTIEMYLKEIAADFGEDGEGLSLTGLIVSPEDINEKYLRYASELSSMVVTTNVEKFSQALTAMSKDELLCIRRLLNGIKTCHTEFKLSHADEYAAQIDTNHTKKLLKAVQDRIDFVNLQSRPTDLLSIISNKEVVAIIYQFFKVKVEILDLSKLTEGLKALVDSEQYKKLVDLVAQVQEEIKRNRNHDQIEMVKLDKVLQMLFTMLDIENLDYINAELEKALADVKRINDENERLAARYDGNYAFVKTYNDTIETYSELSEEDVSSFLDIVYAAVREITSNNILILQGRENFISSIKNLITTKLIKAKLYSKFKDYYDSLLAETYANMKVF